MQNAHAYYDHDRADRLYRDQLRIDEDRYVRTVTYGARSQILTKEHIGTRYAFVVARTLARHLKALSALVDCILRSGLTAFDQKQVL